jgi:ribosomal-protein-alanine N-acetyltransferase
MTKAPTIKTDRLLLSNPVVYKDMDMSLYLSWLNNKRLMKYSEQRHQKHTKESQYQYLSRFYDSDDMYWDIRLNDEIIGGISAACDLPNMVANVGILIGNSACWGRGFGQEGYGAVCDYLFQEGFRKIEAGTMSANGKMISILHKLSFTQEAIIRGHFLLKGQPQDMYLYAKFKEASIIPFNRS